MNVGSCRVVGKIACRDSEEKRVVRAILPTPLDLKIGPRGQTRARSRLIATARQARLPTLQRAGMQQC
jgi:hypothetical protein